MDATSTANAASITIGTATAAPAPILVPRTLSLLIPTADPPTEVRLFRPGANDTEKGVFHFTPDSARLVMEAAARWQNEYSFDYEHQALQHPPVEAPAAAWYRLEVRDTPDGPELWAVGIRWTDRALERLRAREYRYISPAFVTDEDGQIVEFVNVALTNLPATRNLPALVASRTNPPTGAAGARKEGRMKALMRTLGLTEDASEAAALEVVTTLTAHREVVQHLAREVPEGADLLGTVLAWRDGAARTEALAARTTELEAEIEKRDRDTEAAEVERLTAQGLTDGKMTPASRDALLKALTDANGRVDPARLRAYLDAAPRVVPTSATAAKEPARGVNVTPERTEWEALSNVEKHALAVTDHDEFVRILTDHRAARAA